MGKDSGGPPSLEAARSQKTNWTDNPKEQAKSQPHHGTCGAGLTHTCTHTHTHTHTPRYLRSRAYTRTHTFTHTTVLRAYSHVCTHTHTPRYSGLTHVCAHTHTHTRSGHKLPTGAVTFDHMCHSR